MAFNYYYGSQAEQFSFVRIPRIMLTDKAFRELSITAKVLYGVLLDRMSLSMKNSWFDKENRVYIIYQIGEIMEDLGFSKKKAMELLQELESFGLLEKKRRGHGLPNILYLKNFMKDTEDSVMKNRTPVKDMNVGIQKVYSSINAKEVHIEVDSSEMGSVKTKNGRRKSCSRGSENDTSDSSLQYSRSIDFSTQEVPEMEPLEVPDSAPLMNHTNNIYTYRNKTESNHILLTKRLGRYDAMRSGVKSDGKAKAYEQLIRENIDFDSLIVTHPHDRELLDGIVDLILETVLCRQDYILIASKQLPTDVVRSKFLKLEYSHIEYVLNCLRRNTTKVNNIKKYLLAALFNAPSTMDGYYQSEMQHDMPQLAVSR